MNTLKIPLAAVSAEGCPVEAVLAIADLRPEGIGDLDNFQVGPVSVQGTLSALDSKFLFEGSVSGAFAHACDRCLEAMSVPFSTQVLWTFVEGTARDSAPSGDADDDASSSDDEEDVVLDDMALAMTYTGATIDLAPAAWEEILLTAPTKFLCQEDCRGLCPACGVNRNRETCACRPEDIDGQCANKGLSGLGSLFPELRPDHSEE